MTQTRFISLCNEYCIAPSVALENDAIRAALAARNDNEVERILREEF